ncbi:sensor histidine kinase [Mucilaginibacter segetis]|uniref:histidine kinase n=1 Tax=Mucilaginibacter segetis TaxID=2793071 RepID=A0A934UM53_9SPHI|nr:HAMP domain-containing sensor histidine kinase [Mucilaginibacter segetis]MBK0378517.1 HAMP domain-containing histidine kinase [Mucilaginibacter segetis]
MKLLDRYNRVNLLSTILMIVVTGFIYYFTISYILTGQVDKDLLVEENEIFDYVKLNHRLPQVFKSDDLHIQFTPIGTNDTVDRKFLNTRFFDAREREEETGRTLFTSVTVGGRHYKVEITESTVETEDLIRLIFIITLGVIFCLLVVLLLINRVLMRKLWDPFNQTLTQIKRFNLADQNGIHPVESKIDEFHDLNTEVTAMSQRVLHDYQSLKTFTENASHELMTPLAVIMSKLDILMQVPDMTDYQGGLMSEVYDTVGRLKKLNRSMLLLSRIENRLMPTQEEIEIALFIRKKTVEFQELTAEKGLKLTEALDPVKITINRDLLNILLNNLLGNAILHNRPEGMIIIDLNPNRLSISNTGADSPLNADTIFQRFYKSPASEGTGLGLTLVSQICENYGYGLNYIFQDGLHTFTIRFSA